ncbi:MAG TPA: zf-TFIIB domain-containing protein, partial [Actinomycetota bacterium]|nr:zf-TFIIB domain-containing protein [Actinomycetota bacterium]
MATDLICPKCQGLMRTYERSGVTVDQCSDCRGIFLDRGELERLVDAEQGWQRSH